MKDPKTLAIEAALRADWDTAIAINEGLIREDPDDIESLNRLAFAKMEKGELPQAQKLYQKILSLDPFNPIAQRNLEKLSNMKEGKNKKGNSKQFTNPTNMFLEESGKTKVVKLKNPAELHILAQLRAGDEIVLTVKRRGIVATDTNGIYLGALPDDIAHRLIPMIKYGNKYEAHVKSIDRNTFSIFIKEVERAPRFKNQPSFSSTTPTYLTSVREDVIDEEKPNVATLEELEEEEEEEEEK